MQNAKLIALFAMIVSVNACTLGGKTMPFNSISEGLPGPPGPAGPGTFTEETSIISVRDYGATGDGITGDRDAIYNAIAAANNRELLFPAGTYRVESDLTFSSTVAVRFLNGAKLSIDNGVTVTINGPLEAGLYQIFSGDGSASIGKGAVPMVYPQWWGALGDGSTDSSDAFNKALEAVKNGGTLYVGAGTYILNTPINNFPYDYPFYERTGIVIRGAGMGETILRYMGTSGYCVELTAEDELTNKTVCHCTLVDLHVQAPNIGASGGGGVLFAGASFCHLERVAFTSINNTYGTAIGSRRKNVTVSDTGYTNDTDRDFTTSGAGVSEKYAIKFTTTPTGTSKVKQATVKFGKTGTPSGTITAYIYDDNSGEPGSQVGGASDPVDCADLSSDADGGDVTFTFSAYDDMPDVLGTTDYWLVLTTTGYTYIDGVTEVRLRVDSGDGNTDGFAAYDAGTSTWFISNDGSNTLILLRYNMCVLNALRGIYVQGSSRARYGIKMEENTQFQISDSNFETVAGIVATGNPYITVSRTQFSTSGDTPVSITGGQSYWSQCYLEGAAKSYPIYLEGKTLHTFSGCHIAGYMTWAKNTPVKVNNCYGPFFYTDDPTVISDQFQYKIIGAGDDRIYLRPADSVSVVNDSEAITGECIQLATQSDWCRINFNNSPDPDFPVILPRGTYLFTVFTKAANTVTGDLRMNSGYYDIGGNPIFLTDLYFTPTTIYTAYRIIHVVTTDEVGDGTFVTIQKYQPGANTIWISHVVIEYLGPDILLNHDTVSYNSDASDADGARSSKHIFIGRQSGGEQSVLGSITVSHDGSGDDQKGKMEFGVNSGNDGESPETFASIDSNGRVGVSGMLYTGTIATFANGDSTPDVSMGNVFRTANTAPTTVTMFDYGMLGQTITVIFGDENTTVDFTGTNLKGNNGIDWNPASGDHMTCIFDGINWYCTISDNTP